MVSSLLVFGVIPKIPVHPWHLLKQRERMIALHNSRKYMPNLINKARLTTAMKCHYSGATDRDRNTIDQVLVYRDEPISWCGRFQVADHEKAVFIVNNGKVSQHSIDQIEIFSRRRHIRTHTR